MVPRDNSKDDTFRMVSSLCQSPSLVGAPRQKRCQSQTDHHPTKTNRSGRCDVAMWICIVSDVRENTVVFSRWITAMNPHGESLALWVRSLGNFVRFKGKGPTGKTSPQI